MRIGKIAELTGLSTKTIRFYEKEHVLQTPARGENSYRDYGIQDVERMKFLRRIRLFDFSLEKCRTLLALLANPNRRAHEVKKMAEQHLTTLLKKKQELEILCAELTEMVDACSGDGSAQCAILDRFCDKEKSCNG